MLAVEKTGAPGLALSVPNVVTLKAEPYLAIAAKGPMPKLPQFAPPKFDELHNWMAGHDVDSGGKAFFRYRRFDNAGNVELEVGNTTLKELSANGNVIAGELPAGRYASATYTGPYDRLYDCFLMLDGWLRGRGLAPAGKPGQPDCQLEVYRVAPATEPDPNKWVTDLMIRLKD
jgi:hypothetical protein